jgi:predicted PurR-regulated permease PerM
MAGKSSRLPPPLGSLAVVAGVIVCAVLLWGLRSLILPIAAGALFAYVCYPLVANLERFRLTRGLAIVLLLMGLVLAGLFVFTQLRASIPDESGLLELRVRALHNINRRYQALMGLDPSLTAGNRVYQLVHADVDPLLDRVNRALALEPEERSRFLASRTSGSAESDALLRYDAENQQMLEARGQAALARSGPEGAPAESATASHARARTPLASLGGILSTWIVAPAVFLFFLRDTGEIKRRFFRTIPNRLFEPALSILADLDRALGGWLRGVFLESAFLGVSMAVLLAVLGVPLGWAILIGLAAAASNPIPYVGSAVALLGGLAYSLVADTVHPLLPWVRGESVALWIVVGVALIEIVKNLVFEPFVLGHAAELHPLAVLIGVLGGGILFGVVGLVLALPTLTISRALVSSTARQFKAYGLV